MPDLMRLIDDHHAMDALADELLALARPSPDAARCRALMTSLAGLLTTHLAREAAFLRHKPDSAQADFLQALTALIQAFGLLTEDWHAYLERWSDASRIAADRARYAGETADILTALKLRIAHENDVVYPLALDAGRIALV